MSYLRLFALGLASAQLAVTFNNLASGCHVGSRAWFLLAIVILLVGHSVNLLLGIMCGVVHGLRLNCIEFFNASLTEEGQPFKPFSENGELVHERVFSLIGGLDGKFLPRRFRALGSIIGCSRAGQAACGAMLDVGKRPWSTGWPVRFAFITNDLWHRGDVFT